MKNTYFKSFLYVAVFLLSIGMYAQTISGIVTSEDGPLPGAAVQIKGTNTGVSTDFDGNFSIEAGADDTLVISFVGFATQEVLVGDQDQITVTLEVANPSRRGNCNYWLWYSRKKETLPELLP